MKKWHFNILLFSILVSLLSPKSGKAQTASFYNFTTEDGLSHNAVLAITQDKRGFLWIGTEQGLNRFDGAQFWPYLLNSGKTSWFSNMVHSIFADSQGRIWVGTATHLNIYDEKKNTFSLVNFPPNGNAPNPRAVYTIFEDRAQTIWIGTSKGLYYIKNNKPETVQYFETAQPLAGKDIRSIFEDQSRQLWVGTSTGLSKISYTKQGQQVVNYFANEASQLSGNFITSIADDEHGSIWVGTRQNGINIYHPEKNQFSPLTLLEKEEHIRKIFRDINGQIWIGTQDGLALYHPNTHRLTRYIHDKWVPNSLSQNSIYSIFQDKKGSIWAGTYFGGLNMLNPFSNRFFDLASYLRNPALGFNSVISGLMEDAHKNLWIGTEGGGIYKVNLINQKVENYTHHSFNDRSLSSNNIKAIYADSDQNIWIATHAGGLNLYHPQSNNFSHYIYNPQDPNSSLFEISSILEDGQHHLWVGSNKGLTIYDREGTKLTRSNLTPMAPLHTNRIRTLLKDAAGNIWIGCNNGTFLYLTGSQKYIKISNNVPNCFLEAQPGLIWVGVQNNGLNVFNYKTNQYKQIKSADGFGTNLNIMGMLADSKNRLWISTNKGILEYHPETNQYRRFTREDGLTNENFNFRSSLQLKSRELLFGGVKGITVFNADHLNINKSLAPLQFTNFQLFDSTLEPGASNKDVLKENMVLTKTLALKHDQNIFSIHYALLNFIHSAKNRYAYMLEGYNKDWITTSETHASFTNIPPGNYTFKVKGANNDNIWGNPIQLAIHISPPFWATWWAYLFYIALLGLLGFLLLRFIFMRAILKKETELQKNKLNFFTNISHEMRTHTTLISAPLENLISRKNFPLEEQQQLETLQRNTQHLVTLVNELMDFRKAETGSLTLHLSSNNLIDLLQELVASFQDLAYKNQDNLELIFQNAYIPLYFDAKELRKVFTNLLSNAFKYSPPKSRIEIKVEENDTDVTISVRDNGHGILPQYLEKIFDNYFQVQEHESTNTGYGIGLAFSKSIIDLHQGQIWATSSPAKEDQPGETNFFVRLKKGQYHFSENLPSHNTQTKLPAAPILEPHLEPLAEIWTSETGDKNQTLLIVEDNENLQQLFKQLFSNRFELIFAGDGLEGQEAAFQHIPNLIISDVMMPKMDGFTFCNIIKEDSRTSHIPVILLTAKSSQQDQISGLGTGADLYLTKPFSSQILLLSVRNMLAAREKLKQRIYASMTQLDPEEPEIAEGPDTELSVIDQEFIKELAEIIEKYIDQEELGVGLLSKKIGMSPPILYKKLHAISGMTVNEFIKSHKLRKAADILVQEDDSIEHIALSVGYKDARYFSREFKKVFGLTPRDYADKRRIISKKSEKSE